MMMIKGTAMHKTWVLVADAHQAEIWSCNSRHELQLTKTMRPVEQHQFNKDINADRPGRAFSSAGMHRSAIEPHHAPLEREHDLFVRELVETLQKAALEKYFDQLGIIAPAKMLGALREQLDHPIDFKIIGEQAKDLMKLPKDEVEAHIRDLVGLH
jgi:protein required for attachment to host cells